MPAAEVKMIWTFRSYSVGYAGPCQAVLYSRNLCLHQCKLHLKDGKGTYERIRESKKQISVSVVDKLKYLLVAFSKSGSARRLPLFLEIRDANFI